MDKNIKMIFDEMDNARIYDPVIVLRNTEKKTKAIINTWLGSNDEIIEALEDLNISSIHDLIIDEINGSIKVYYS